MALVMLVRTTPNPRTRHKQLWDVISIGLGVTRWGREEIKHHQRVVLDADDIQQMPLRMRQRVVEVRSELQAMLAAGDTNPIIVTPFSTVTWDKTRPQHRKLKGVNSEFFFDLDQLPGPMKARVKDPTIAEPPIDYSLVKNHHGRRTDLNDED